jgi:hypothetical protein
MQRRKRRKVDVTQLTEAQKRNYKKRLAQVRNYTRLKREWVKRIKLGEINPKITFEMYRKANSEGKPIESMEDLEEDVKYLKANARSNEELGALRKIESLIRELKRVDDRKKKILDTILHLDIGEK